MINIFIRTITAILFIVRIFYWEYSSWQTNKLLPKRSTKLKGLTAYVSDIPMSALIIVQLFGFIIFPMSANIWIQLVGFAIVVIGMITSFKARVDISTNWTHAGEYQVKEKQTLTTKGIYSVIRHPIYVSFALSYMGAELVAQSWLFISCVGFFIAAYIQGKREEKILLAHFGEKYKEYMKRTKMLIPWLF